MRLYTNATEMYEETKRDLKEMGILVTPKSMQDKVIEGMDEFKTQELQDYSYRLLDADPIDVICHLPVNEEWAKMEFHERVTDPFTRAYDKHGKEYLVATEGFINPGEAWKIREDVWSEYLHDGKMAYTYNERIWWNDQVSKLIKRLKEDPDSRQLWLSIWNPSIDPNNLGGISRVPCSLGYNIQVRNGKLNLHYVMRSCDFATHFANDVYLAIRFMYWLCDQTGYKPGDFTHTMFSLHVYQKDVQGVF